MTFVKLEDSIYFDSEYGMSDDIDDVYHQKAVEKVGHRKIIIEPVNQAYLLCREDRDLGQINNDADNG
jgi:hypothetical protein